MSSLFPSGPREPPEFARPQRLGVLPTMAYWNGTGLGFSFVGFLAAVGAIATRGTLPKAVGLSLGVLVGLLILGLVERAHRRRHARTPAPAEAVGPESHVHATEPRRRARDRLRRRRRSRMNRRRPHRVRTFALTAKVYARRGRRRSRVPGVRVHGRA